MTVGPEPRRRSMLAGLRPLVDPRARWSIVALAGASALGGLTEAGALVLISSGAIAISSGNSTVSVVGRTMSTGTALLAATVLLVVRLFFAVATSRLTATISARAYGRLTARLVDGFLHASWEAKSSERTGELQYLVTASALTASNSILYIGQGMVTGFSLLVLLVVSLTLNPLAVLVMAVTGVGLFLLLRPLSQRGRTLAGRLNETHRQFGVNVTETASVSREVATFDVTDTVGDGLHTHLDDMVGVMESQRTINQFAPLLYQTTVFGAAVAFLVIVKVAHGKTAVLAGIVILLLRALTYGQGLQFMYHNLQGSMPIIDEVVDRIDHLESSRPSYGRSAVDRIASVALCNVGFVYPNGTIALTDSSVSFGHGEAIGIIGPSGGGKSTMVQILLRLRVPTSGTYLINDADAMDLSTRSFAERVAFVPQDPKLISGTIADNVRFFRPFSDADVRRACRAAQLEDEILELANGYETPAGDGGGHLSGGQKQRLCIARALVGSPDLLILDEPTSALDALSESRIQQMLHSVHGTVTLVIVAHRLTTIQSCDRVVVLESGVVRAFDSFRNLSGTNHFFDEAVRLSTLPS